MYKIENVLTNTERKILLKKCKPLVTKIPNFPGLQSSSDIHKLKELEFFYNIFTQKIQKKLNKNFIIKRSWVNEDIGKKEDICWHRHSDVDYTCVYYIKTLPYFNSGTLFESEFLRMKQNSFLIFDGRILHATPSHPFHFIKRYSLVIDIILT